MYAYRQIISIKPINKKQSSVDCRESDHKQCSKIHNRQRHDLGYPRIVDSPRTFPTLPINSVFRLLLIQTDTLQYDYKM